MNFVIAAGGTGGHLFPGLAVGEVLLARGHQVMLLISEKEIDATATQGRTEFRIEKVPGMGMPSIFSPAILKFLLRFRAGLARCRQLYAEWQPAAVLGMGGFTSTAPILAARQRGIPAFLHESNAIPGKANKLNGRLAQKVLLGFGECAQYFGSTKCEVTGTPIRQSLAQPVPREQALAAFGLSPEKRTLLAMGGSQGAQGINQALRDACPTLHAAGLQVIHLAGKEDVESLRSAYAAAGVPAWVNAFHHRMEEAYSAADLTVARSGAASLTEVSHYGLPSILIPYPHAAEDHQTLNARIFEKAGAALLLPQNTLRDGLLSQKLRWLLDDPTRLSAMSAASAQLAVRDAAQRVADVLLSHLPG